MKRVLQILATVALLLLPQMVVAQEELSAEVPTLTQYEQNHAQTLYEGAKWMTIGSAAMTATGAIAWYCIDQHYRKNAHSDVIDFHPLDIICMLQTLVGGGILIGSLPFYLWGWDLTHNPDGVGLALGGKQGWGGRVDLGLGGKVPVSIGGSVGYNFSRRFYAGLGVGYEKRLFGYGDYNYATIPVYADLQWRFGESRITPYLGVKAGFDVNGVPIPYGSLDWGVSYRCQKSKGAWWYALSLSNNEKNQVSFRISRSF